MDKKYLNFQFSDKDYDLAQQLKRNIYVFAAFKNHSNIMAMVEALQEDGKIVDFNTFKEKAEQIARVYNIDWLRTEYQTAIAQAQMAVKWNDIQRDKQQLPLLRYEAVNDERTRPAHAALHGVTLPVDDPFWEEYYPPNGFNCRCIVRQLVAGNEIVKPESLPTIKETPSSFLNNAGITGQLYSEEHPYFKEVTKVQKAAILETTYQFLLEDNKAFKDSLKRIKRTNTKLSELEEAAVYHYTTKAVQQLNLKLRLGREDDQNWSHAQLVSQALGKLPNYKGTTYRFVASESLLKKLQQSLEDKTPFVDKGFVSTSTSIDFIQRLIARNNKPNQMVFTIQSKTGKKIDAISNKPQQKEVIFDKNSRFEVQEIIEELGIYYITLKQL